MDLSNDSVRILISLAPGYLAYCAYKVDSDWRLVRPIEEVYGSLIFSVIGFGFAHGIADLTGTGNLVAFIVETFVCAIVFALVYKKWLEGWFNALLRWAMVTNEDAHGSAWQKIFNEPRLYISQISAYMKSGEAIGCNNTASFYREDLTTHGIYPYYTDRDGQICFVPNRRRLRQHQNWEDIPEVEQESPWGLRYVFINPKEMERLELRVIAR